MGERRHGGILSPPDCMALAFAPAVRDDIRTGGVSDCSAGTGGGAPGRVARLPLAPGARKGKNTA
ncbi:hypothetical protein GCM10017621_31160 [Maricaulis virginensis]|uniref:Uncharacterized protein n=1 Tax=Maricaulis virginensis TaxID=144022 RepID=A0A9W6MPV1_9PROT|nr:hypothetical protein GCM10017621_31160 [Maricaulis virginensis]